MAANYPEDMWRLAQLAIDGDYDQVRELATTQLVQAQDGDGRTVLMLVADSAWTPQPTGKCIEYFIHLGSEPSATDNTGNTAAHLAARRNHLRLLALLPFDAKFVSNKEGVTPLMEAVQNQSWQCATHLLYLFRQSRYFRHKAKLLGMKNSRGQTVLQMAEESGRVDDLALALALVIEREMRLVVNNECKISGLTAEEVTAGDKLRDLAKVGDAAGLREAAKRLTCDLPDDSGWTALMMATVGFENSKAEAAAQHLLDLGADATCATVEGFSCLNLAPEYDGAAAVPVLAAAGAPVNARAGSAYERSMSKYDRTPLMRAACAHPDTAAASVRALLAAGADWSLKDSRGQTALDVAKSRGRSESAAALLLLEGKAFFDQPMQLTEAERARVVLERRLREAEERRLRGD